MLNKRTSLFRNFLMAACLWCFISKGHADEFEYAELLIESEVKAESHGLIESSLLKRKPEESTMERLTDQSELVRTDTESIEGFDMASTPEMVASISSKNGRDWAGFSISGWGTTGFTWNPLNPENGLNRPVLFNDQSNEFTLDQAYGVLEWESANWNVETRIDFLLGNDARFIGVPGLEKHHDGSEKWSSESNEVQVAIPQAYLLIESDRVFPIELKIGHFVAPESYESFSSLSNVFYSRSYAFNFATPFTYSGILAKATISEWFEGYAGVTTGWDNWHAGRGRWSTLLGLKRTNYERSQSYSLFASVGTDSTNVIYQGGHDSDRRLSIRASIEQRIGSYWNYAFNAIYGEQDESVVRVDIPQYTIGFDKANWYGLSQYLIWTPTQWSTAGVRMEWFRDADQSRIAVPVEFVPFGPAFTGGNYFAISGVISQWINSSIRIRSELRWDISDFKGNGNVPSGNPEIRAFGDRHSVDQWLLSGDVTIRF
ncbi:outer membrane beta-barrel protein [Roseiconus lacunae]|uniref:outer membrane beta-barrel protein n=1 Tax=Roseiconus lacunae TaxID=2605694 RepID=UPI001E493E8D|nr:outer membrane beta-barrel protein [Roseiconus lacunae]MCD0459663.1 porin [Roseiconus lacunae]